MFLPVYALVLSNCDLLGQKSTSSKQGYKNEAAVKLIDIFFTVIY
jgi:hypothetical protein